MGDYKQSAAYLWQLKILESEHAEERLICSEEVREKFKLRTTNDLHARLRRFNEVSSGSVYGGD